MKEKVKIVIAMLIIFIVLYAFLNYKFKMDNTFYSAIQINEKASIEELYSQIDTKEETIQITQKFKAIDNRLKKVELFLRDVDIDKIVQEKENILIGIKADGIVIQEEKMQYKSIKNGFQYTLQFEEQLQSKDKEYEIFIKMKNRNLSWYWLQEEVSNENIRLEINGEQIQGNLCFIEYYHNVQIETIVQIVYIILAILVITLTIALYERDIKQETAFLLVVPLTCLAFILAMPLGKAHDESIHWYKICELLQGKMISNSNQIYIPEGAYEACELKDEYTGSVTYSSILNKKGVDINSENKEYITRTASYSPINYAPHTIAAGFAKLFTKNSIIIAYIARIGNCILCITLIYFAIKTIPFGKNLIFLLSLIPIGIEGFSSLSADGMAIASTFLWIAYVLKLSYDKSITKIKKTHIMKLFVLACVVSLCKTVYLPVILIVFFIPKEKWKIPSDKKVIGICIFIFATIVDAIWYLLSTKTGTNSLGIATQEVLLHNPISYVQKVIYTIIMQLPEYICEIFGGKLGWNEYVKLNIVPLCILVLSILMSTLGDKKEGYYFSIKHKIIIEFIIFTVIALVLTSMYLGWSTLGTTFIIGVQGRYFLPILPLFYLLIGKGFCDDEKWTKRISAIGYISIVYTVISIMIYHI